DKTDGVTEETGLTTAAAAIFLSKNGGDFAAKNEASANVHDQDGWYIIIFDATDTNTVGELIVMIQAPATHLPVWKTYYVVEEDTYTWMFAAGSAPDTQVAAIKTDTTAILVDTGTTLDARLSKLTDAMVLSSSTIQTVTSQTVFVIPNTDDAVDDDAYNGAMAVFIDGTDPNQKSIRLITDYDAGTRKVTVAEAPDFTITTSDTLTILASASAGEVWDQVLTGNTHNLTNSSGKRLRQIEQAFVHASGTIANVDGNHTVTLDGGAVATADYYIGDRLQIAEGTGAGQSRVVTAYSSGKVVILDSDWTINPDTNSLYELDAADVHVSLSDADLASGFVSVATNTTTITLDATNAVATTDYYKNEFIVFTHGTGAGQA
ncbi:hypothetical protein LCGC14_2942750, partial [marine sediment metagenome]